MPEKLLLTDLLAQLDRWGEKGQLKANTARAFKSASDRVLSVLGSPTEVDILDIDLDDAIQRFHNLNPDVTSDSLREYRRRIQKAIGMFIEFKNSPADWKPQAAQRSSTGTQRTLKNPRDKRQTARTRESLNSQDRESEPRANDTPLAQTLTMPFPLRPNLTVSIAGLPRDLKTAECERLSAFLRALAIDYPSDATRNSATS